MNNQKKSFNQQYFHKIYAPDETIDGDFNAKDHANYLESLFEVMGYHATSIYDYGFGKGNLLKAVSEKLGATKVGGCDISEFAFKKLTQKTFASNWKLEINEIYKTKVPKKPYHLGLCNSVLQYLDAKDVAKAVQVMSKSCRYLYLHVPTKEDYKILKTDLQFEDPYAQQRPNSFYHKLLSKHFYFVSWGLLESKRFSSHKTSVFTDSLYRF